MTRFVALIETASGDVAAIQFPSREAANCWAHSRGYDLLSVRPLVTRTEAVALIGGDR